MHFKRALPIVALLWCLLLSIACASQTSVPKPSSSLKPVALSSGAKLQVVATTSIIADMAANVGGDLIELRTLLPIGTDPHTFEPTPRDATMLTQAHLILANGAGLESFLEPLLKNAASRAALVELSEGVALRSSEEEHKGEKRDEKGHGDVDPHTWMTPQNAMIFVANIQRALSALDPAHAATYQANAERYTAQLKELDAWIRAQIETIPAERRRLVTDHESLGYYAEYYGIEIVGAVIPNVSTLAEPSAQQITALIDAVRQQGVKAIFVDTAVNPNLAQRVASETGAKIVRLYSGSLGEKGSGAETYIDYMRYNTNAIVSALQ